MSDQIIKAKDLIQDTNTDSELFDFMTCRSIPNYHSVGIVDKKCILDKIISNLEMG